MHYWRKDFFESLKRTASSARAIGTWLEYADFCLEYERGLRRQAFAILHRFISDMERKPFEERRRFVSWLLTTVEGQEARHMLIPNPLQIQIVEPTLMEWTQVEPHCAEPHRWIGDREHLERALELDPDDQIARRKLIIQIMRYIDYATHHLPSVYLGSPVEDLAVVEKAEFLLKGIANETDKASLATFIAEEKTAIQEYLRGK
ncbi:MAG TPA: hypothetical protein VHZ52_07670 [Acidobacteriaceae bacterium]|jgi:hypothetical protein|nr:hypothetical protein [Acidobacteriaceae bacterium]